MPDLDALHKAFDEAQQIYHKCLHQWATDARDAAIAKDYANSAECQASNSRTAAEKAKEQSVAAETALKQALGWPGHGRS